MIRKMRPVSRSTIGTGLPFLWSGNFPLVVSISGPQEGVGALLAMKRQGDKLAVGLLAFLIAAMVPLHLLWRFAGPAFSAATGMVYVAALFGDATKGASRWIRFAGTQFQPVDVARMCAVIYVARLVALASRDGGAELRQFRAGEGPKP